MVIKCGIFMAYITRSITDQPIIPSLVTSKGFILCSYYQTVHSTLTTPSISEMKAFLSEILLPVLSNSDRDSLDDPRNFGLHLFIPTNDGLLIEFYNEYAEFLAPRLLKVYHAAVQAMELSKSLHEATMRVIPKPGKL